jgi:hypothetical protein
VSEVSYLAKDPVNATREVADLAREAADQATDFSELSLSFFLSSPRAAGKGRRGSAAARNKQDLAGFA